MLKILRIKGVAVNVELRGMESLEGHTPNLYHCRANNENDHLHNLKPFAMKSIFFQTALAALALLFFTPSASAQKPVPDFSGFHKNIYVEFFGSNLLMGVNYDQRLRRGQMDGIGFRAGIGGFSAKGTDQGNNIGAGIVTFPLEFNHVLGKRRSALVTGIGLLPVYATASVNGPITNNEVVIDEGFGLVGGFLNIGYRAQPLRNGIVFQAQWNPMILRGSGFHTGWFGLGIGVGFK